MEAMQRSSPKSKNHTSVTYEVIKYVFLFFFGGCIYYVLEVWFRGFSHISMLLCGGTCFVLIGRLNENPARELAVVSQMVIGSGIITGLELLTGIIVNVILHLNVWDYSGLAYNLWGQICLSYSTLWFFLSFVCIVLDDLVRVVVFDEPKKKYRWL